MVIREDVVMLGLGLAVAKKVFDGLGVRCGFIGGLVHGHCSIFAKTTYLISPMDQKFAISVGRSCQSRIVNRQCSAFVVQGFCMLLNGQPIGDSSFSVLPVSSLQLGKSSRGVGACAETRYGKVRVLSIFEHGQSAQFAGSEDCSAPHSRLIKLILSQRPKTTTN